MAKKWYLPRDSKFESNTPRWGCEFIKITTSEEPKPWVFQVKISLNNNINNYKNEIK